MKWFSGNLEDKSSEILLQPVHLPLSMSITINLRRSSPCFRILNTQHVLLFWNYQTFSYNDQLWITLSKTKKWKYSTSNIRKASMLTALYYWYLQFNILQKLIKLIKLDISFVVLIIAFLNLHQFLLSISKKFFSM